MHAASVLCRVPTPRSRLVVKLESQACYVQRIARDITVTASDITFDGIVAGRDSPTDGDRTVMKLTHFALLMTPANNNNGHGRKTETMNVRTPRVSPRRDSGTPAGFLVRLVQPLVALGTHARSCTRILRDSLATGGPVSA